MFLTQRSETYVVPMFALTITYTYFQDVMKQDYVMLCNKQFVETCRAADGRDIV
jgi:hypothetical protein